MRLHKRIYNKIDLILIKNRFERDLKKFTNNNNQRFEIDKKRFLPNYVDATETTDFDGHYVYHPAWALRILKKNNPKLHIDIGSTLSFSSMASAYHNVEFYDFRPANLNLDNLTSSFADLISLPFESNSISSLSCMHTVEHVGLGRYGDKIDYDGDLKAIEELKRVVIPNGNLLFVVPIGGVAKIIFNSHRIYNYQQVINSFENFELMNFALITDNNEYKPESSKIDADRQDYGCGCFWFVKKMKND